MNAQKSNISRPAIISDRDFKQFQKFIYDQCGINLAPAKKTMLTARLQKRMRALSIESFKQYYDFVTSAKGQKQELVHMIDAISTNKTEFFRESAHFDYLSKNVLPDLHDHSATKMRRRLQIWSAGCSSGQEPYTLAMVLDNYFSALDQDDFAILATDISTRVLQSAQKAIYTEEDAQGVPPVLRRRYMMRGKNARKGLCRVVPELRNRITFQRLNLVARTGFGLRKAMDIIFCRNVIIYFDRATQITLFERFFNQLAPGGYLFIGRSESLHGINDQFIPCAVSVYRKPRHDEID